MRLYGSPASQASRSIWALEEAGLDYELVATAPYRDTASVAFLALNPNGKVPVLVDGDAVIWESVAINLYVAQRAAGKGEKLWPVEPRRQGEIYKWSLWVVTEVEPHLWEMWQSRELDAPRANAAGNRLRKALEILEGHLTSREWLVGGAFSIADLNVESYVIRARRGGYDLSVHPSLWAWIERAERRPARRRVRRMIENSQDPTNPPRRWDDGASV